MFFVARKMNAVTEWHQAVNNVMMAMLYQETVAHPNA